MKSKKSQLEDEILIAPAYLDHLRKTKSDQLFENQYLSWANLSWGEKVVDVFLVCHENSFQESR